MSKHFMSDPDDPKQVARRQRFIERMERKWEIKKSLNDSPVSDRLAA